MIEGSFDTGQDSRYLYLFECTEAVTVYCPTWYPVRAGEIPPDGDYEANTSHNSVTTYTTSCNEQNSYILPTRCIYVFCMVLRINSDYFLVGFYNRDGVFTARYGLNR
jgi:hypothetical protein